MDIVRLVEEKFLLVAKKMLEALEGGTDYLSFEMALRKELDGLGCEIVEMLLQTLEQKIYESDERKHSWEVVRKNDRKVVLTPFGVVEFKRRYYRHRNSKEYKYLVDEKFGITPHQKVGINLKAQLAEAASEVSYETAAVQVSRNNAATKVSKQTAANCVKDFEAQEPGGTAKKRRVERIFIEADEDHVKVRGRNGAQARLIYIHEGIEEGPRRRLKNARYFTTVDKTPEEFWTEVDNYLQAHYELSGTEVIYLSGDGARWIQAGKEYIPGAIYILDKFHLAKYIIKATAHASNLRPQIYQAIQKIDKQAVLDTLQEALSLAERPPRQKRIQDTMRYISNNWDGIEASVKYPDVGCSAEGHVSHILSARLSSRPMAWSVTGAGNMASMRAVRANKESVRAHYLAAKEPSPALVEINQEVKRELRRVEEKILGKEYIANIPLFSGKSSLTRDALRGLNGQMII